MSEMTIDASCVLCRRRPSVGYLCQVHLDRFAQMLRDVEDQANMLDARPSMQQRTGSGGGSLASHRSPVVLDVIVATDPRRGTAFLGDDLRHDPWGIDDTASILDTLHSWARVVREDRDFAPPQQVTISGERDLLTRQLDWVAAQDWVDEAYDDVRRLLSQLKATNHTQDEQPVGTCYRLDPEDGEKCGGHIWQNRIDQPVWRIKGDRCELEVVKAAHHSAHCDRCRSTWEGAELARLMLILEQESAEAARPRTADGRRMLTAQEMADKLGMKLGTFRVAAHRASQRGVVSVNGYYDPEDFPVKACA